MPNKAAETAAHPAPLLTIRSKANLVAFVVVVSQLRHDVGLRRNTHESSRCKTWFAYAHTILPLLDFCYSEVDPFTDARIITRNCNEFYLIFLETVQRYAGVWLQESSSVTPITTLFIELELVGEAKHLILWPRGINWIPLLIMKMGDFRMGE